MALYKGAYRYCIYGYCCLCMWILFIVLACTCTLSLATDRNMYSLSKFEEQLVRQAPHDAFSQMPSDDFCNALRYTQNTYPIYCGSKRIAHHDGVFGIFDEHDTCIYVMQYAPHIEPIIKDMLYQRIASDLGTSHASLLYPDYLSHDDILSLITTYTYMCRTQKILPHAAMSHYHISQDRLSTLVGLSCQEMKKRICRSHPIMIDHDVAQQSPSLLPFVVYHQLALLRQTAQAVARVMAFVQQQPHVAWYDHRRICDAFMNTPCLLFPREARLWSRFLRKEIAYRRALEDKRMRYGRHIYRYIRCCQLMRASLSQHIQRIQAYPATFEITDRELIPLCDAYQEACHAVRRYFPYLDRVFLDAEAVTGELVSAQTLPISSLMHHEVMMRRREQGRI